MGRETDGAVILDRESCDQVSSVPRRQPSFARPLIQAQRRGDQLGGPGHSRIEWNGISNPCLPPTYPDPKALCKFGVSPRVRTCSASASEEPKEGERTIYRNGMNVVTSAGVSETKTRVVETQAPPLRPRGRNGSCGEVGSGDQLRRASAAKQVP